MLTENIDNWLHAATKADDITHYENPQNSAEINSSDPFIASYQAGFSLSDSCDALLTETLPPNVSLARLPVRSMKQTVSPTS